MKRIYIYIYIYVYIVFRELLTPYFIPFIAYPPLSSLFLKFCPTSSSCCLDSFADRVIIPHIF